ncbi:MAG: efflux RND transporter permease subunit, partial [Pseudomonadales bacterium]
MASDLSAFFKVVGGTAILALIFSIAESQLILPAHLAHRSSAVNRHTPAWTQRWLLFQERMSTWLQHVADQRYKPFLHSALKWRYLTLGIGISAVILVVALMASGRIVFQYFPAFGGDRVYATVTMPEGTPYTEVSQAVTQIERAAQQLRTELDGGGVPAERTSNIKHVIKTIGSVVSRGSIDSFSANDPTKAEVVIELLPDKERDTISSTAIANRWRELTGPVTDAVALQFSADFFSAGEPLNIRLRGPDTEELRTAAGELSAEMERFDGVYDITDSFRSGKQEVQLALRPEAKPLGISLMELGNQVRQAFYGEEAQRVQRGKEDVRVMVRYPELERRSLSDLENMRIRTSEGIEVPFGNVAEAQLGYGFSTIKRENGERVISVIADINRNVMEPERVLEALQEQFVPQLNARYPNIEYSLGGEAEDSMIAMEGLGRWTMLALLIIYALLAIPLHSYSQPLVIMSVIPFGAIGAVLGHFLLGVDLVFFSVLGIVALSGVVVNASLVLVDYINHRRADGDSVVNAVASAGAVRFRPIILTSLTTFVGLIPIMANQNPSTMIFVPMAISLAFGVLFATAVTLLLVPCLYLILDDAVHALHGEPQAGAELI